MQEGGGDAHTRAYAYARARALARIRLRACTCTRRRAQACRAVGRWRCLVRCAHVLRNFFFAVLGGVSAGFLCFGGFLYVGLVVFWLWFGIVAISQELLAQQPGRGIMETVAVVIAAGRNVGNAPMADDTWRQFCADIAAAIANNGGSVAASVVGVSDGGVWGREEAVWLAGDTGDIKGFRASLSALAGAYGQDAIAVTYGTLVLVGA